MARGTLWPPVPAWAVVPTPAAHAWLPGRLRDTPLWHFLAGGAFNYISISFGELAAW